MDDGEELASEEFEVDFRQTNRSWRDGLKRGEKFLNHLQRILESDTKFGEHRGLIRYIVHWLKDNALENTEDFALNHTFYLQKHTEISDDLLRRLDYLVIQLDCVSPKIDKKPVASISFSRRKSSHARMGRH